MQRFKLATLAVFAVMTAFLFKAEGADVKLYVDPDDIEAKGGIAEVDVWYNTDIATLNALDFRVYLPAGFSVQTEDDEYIVDGNTTASRTHTYTMDYITAEAEPYYKIVGFSISNKYLKEGKYQLLSFYVVVPDNFTAANYPTDAVCRLTNISIAEDTEPVIGHHPAAYTFYIRPEGKPTGVEAVSVDESGEEVIYNLQGMRVERPLAPGLYIINGKKKVIK